MAEKIYTYNGPLTGVTLPDGRHMRLVTGGPAQPLPEDNPYVKRLVALNRLTPVAEDQGKQTGKNQSVPQSLTKEVTSDAS